MRKYLALSLFLVIFLSGCGNGVSLDETINVSEDTDTAYSKGNANAAVVITEYSDYQCPFCARFTLDILPQLQNDYIEAGKVLYSFKDFPISSHRYAQKASEASYCVGEQNENLYWDYHTKLFKNQKNLTIEDLAKYADELDVNVSAFNDCLNSGKYRDLVRRNFQDGLKRGVEGTPSIFVNDQKLIGVPQYDNFVKIIETELKK